MLVNGEAFSSEDLGPQPSILDLVQHFGLDPEAVVVERNGSIPGRDAWSHTTLDEGDRIELIKFVGGG